MLIEPHIRWLIRKDMPQVLDIEAASFEFCWTQENFLQCLREQNCIGMVAEHDERVAGFMIYEMHHDRLRLMNFAVHPDVRRHGVGTAMLDKLKSKLSRRRRSRLVLEVRESNLPAQLFFREQGFRATQVLREFYEETPEDAYLFEYRIPASQPCELRSAT